MKNARKQFAARWINDHLDLYNYAISIGDSDWQQEILQTLKAKDEHIQTEQELCVRMELWISFDRINRKMIELYDQLRNIEDSEEEKNRIMEQMWEYKQQRFLIVSKLKEHYVVYGE